MFVLQLTSHSAIFPQKMIREGRKKKERKREEDEWNWMEE